MNRIIQPGQEVRLTQIILFKQIWLYSNRRSFVSGLFLRDFMNSPYFLNIFAHVLSKKQYPFFKYYAANIVLLTPGEHALYDQGTEEKRIAYAHEVKERSGNKGEVDWETLYHLQDLLKKLYGETFPSAVHGIISYKYSKDEVVKKVGNLNKKFWKEVHKAKRRCG